MVIGCKKVRLCRKYCNCRCRSFTDDCTICFVLINRYFYLLVLAFLGNRSCDTISFVMEMSFDRLLNLAR